MINKSLEILYAEHLGKSSDKWELYLLEYDRLFSAYRNKPINILEIGVQNGGSLEIYIVVIGTILMVANSIHILQ